MQTPPTSTSPVETAIQSDEGTEPVVVVRELSKRFRRGDGTTVAALDGVSFQVAAGEFLVLLGPSGCGKTTLLRAIAGLDRPDGGEILIHGKTCFSSSSATYVATEHRGISMIFQSYALWPHMTAFENIAYPLRSNPSRKSRAKRTRTEIRQSVEHVLGLVGIPELIGQFPGQMSGGQQQRVALARALVGGTGLVLFDEPLSNVDAKVRDQLRYELVAMQRELGFAAIYVTHDQDEAMSMADRIAVMGSGKIQQIAPPRAVYFAATSRYVANFVGKSNEIQGSVTEVSGLTVTVATALGRFTGIAANPGISGGDRVTVNWRPEHSRLNSGESANGNQYSGTVLDEVFLGSHSDYHVMVNDQVLILQQPAHVQLDIGSTVSMSVEPEQTRVLKEPMVDPTEA
jgi:ABC-type spermidine/putrescine transport systems, ATPase components